MADQHFCPQAHVLDWLPQTAEVLDVDRLDDEMRQLMPGSWAELPHMNATSGAPSIPFTREFEDVVRTAYAADFRRYRDVFSPYEPPAVEQSTQNKPWLQPGSGFLAQIRAARRLAPWVKAARVHRRLEEDSTVLDRHQALESQAKLLDERWMLMQDMQKRIADCDGTIALQAQVLKEREATITALNRESATKDDTIAVQTADLERLKLQDEATRRQLASIAAHRAQLASRAFLTRRLASLCLPRKGRTE